MTLLQIQQLNARKIASLGDPDMREMLRVLRDARDDAARGLRSWLKKIPADERDQKYTIFRHRALLSELDDSFTRVKRQLAPATVKSLKIETTEAMAESLRQMQRTIARAQKKFGSAVQPLRVDVAQQVIKTGGTLVERHAKSAQRYAGRVGDTMKHELAVGLVRGESVDQIVKRLTGKIQPVYDKMSDAEIVASYGDRGFFRSRYDAERLVRTELIHAANQVQDDLLTDENDKAQDSTEESSGNGGWLKRWDASMDGQVCDSCADMDGQTVEAGEDFVSDDYGNVDGPPLHPNCRCSTLPWREEWDT